MGGFCDTPFRGPLFSAGMGGYTAVFFLILKAFLPLRKPLILKVIAFLVCGFLADSIIYSNDPGSLFGTMLLFFLFVLLFYRGTFMEKLSVLLVFYPALIAINYLMLDTGSRLFKLATGASYNGAMQYCFPATIISRNISSSNPLLITSQNLMLDTGSRLFKLATGASYNGAMQYCFPATIISRNISSSNPLLITSQTGVRAVTGFESNSIFRYSSKSNSFKKTSSRYQQLKFF